MHLLEQHYLNIGFVYRCNKMFLLRRHEYKYKFFKKFVFMPFGHYKMVNFLPQGFVNG